MKTLTNPLSLKEHLAKTGKTIALFVMSVCPFCRRFRPIFESFAEGRSQETDFLTVVLDDDRSPLWEEYGINVVPTVILFEGKFPMHRLDGRPGKGLNEGDLALLK
jgi:thioredoxin-like negative regulator of GroEL